MKIEIGSTAVKTSNWRLNLHRLAKVELPEWLIKVGTNRMASISLEKAQQHDRRSMHQIQLDCL